MVKGLTRLEGVSIRRDSDPLRYTLVSETQMPFAPASYRVWRNYKRVFECSFLATAVEDRLVCSDFCKELANPTGRLQDVDDYFACLVPRFRFPFPAFRDYSPERVVLYPFCAILKLLFAKLRSGFSATLDLAEVFTLIIANQLNGTEERAYYESVKPRSFSPTSDESRQVREMLILLSQVSFLKWHNKRLILDMDLDEYFANDELKGFADPYYIPLHPLRSEDFLSLTNLSRAQDTIRLRPREQPNDELFIEGKRSRITHLNTERSPALRKMFLRANPEPICDMCSCQTARRYPWTQYLIEVHHVLPLSSSLRITSQGTSIEDVVGLCPNCHRSVHLFYNQYLKQYQQPDFKDKKEAVEVYELAKSEIVL